MNRFILLVSSILLFSTITFAQFDCRSILSSHLTPIKKNSNLLWAAEGVASHGLMNDREITNGMIYFGLENYDYILYNCRNSWFNRNCYNSNTCPFIIWR
jgi:hypothetical protein